MLDRDTLVRAAKLFGLKPWQQEKHYLQALALTALADERLVFKGGTYLWFFHGLPRFSEDLDFTAFEALPSSLPEETSEALRLFGVENTVKTLADEPRTLSFRLSAQGPLYTGPRDLCHVYIEISRREQVSKKPVPCKLDFPAYQLPLKTIPGMDLNEAAAEKVRALFTREKARDPFDLHYLVKAKHVSFDETLANQKLAYFGQAFSSKAFTQRLSAAMKQFEKELASLTFNELPPAREVIKTLMEWVPPTVKK